MPSSEAMDLLKPYKVPESSDDSEEGTSSSSSSSSTEASAGQSKRRRLSGSSESESGNSDSSDSCDWSSVPDRPLQQNRYCNLTEATLSMFPGEADGNDSVDASNGKDKSRIRSLLNDEKELCSCARRCRRNVSLSPAY